MNKTLLILAIALCSIACANNASIDSTSENKQSGAPLKPKQPKQEELTYSLDTIDLISPENAENMKAVSDDDEYYDEEYAEYVE
jgi:hypothetical protein